MAEIEKPQVPAEGNEAKPPLQEEVPAKEEPSKKRPEQEPKGSILGPEDKDEKPAKHPKIVPGKAAEEHLKRLEDDGQYKPGDEIDQAASKPIGLEIDQTFSQEIKAGVNDVKHKVEHMKEGVVHHHGHHHKGEENGAGAAAPENGDANAHLAPGGVAAGTVQPEGLVGAGEVGKSGAAAAKE